MVAASRARRRRIGGSKRVLTTACLLLGIVVPLLGPAHADGERVRISRQPGFVYLPMVLVEYHKLIEKHAAAKGLAGVTADFINLTSGAAGNDALLSGSLDLVDSGSTNMLLINEKTRGEIKGICGVGTSPLILLTRNPDVKTLADFTAKDKIALPSVKISSQAVALQIASRKVFGPGGATKLDALTVQLGHPDAVAAIANPKSEVNSHFSLPPFQQRELKDPAIHKVINSFEVLGTPMSNGLLYGRSSWYTRQPKLAEAIVAALDEADAMIAKDPLQAAKDYVAATKDPTPPAELVEIMKEPGTIFSTTPFGIKLVVDHFHEIGLLKQPPKDWKEYFIPVVANMPGN